MAAGQDGGVGRQHAVHVGPDLDLFSIDAGAHDGGGVVAAAAPQRGGDAALGRSDEAVAAYNWTVTNAGDLPVDNHELIALCAPRPVFIGGGASTGDGYANSKGDAWAEVWLEVMLNGGLSFTSTATSRS